MSDGVILSDGINVNDVKAQATTALISGDKSGHMQPVKDTMNGMKNGFLK